MTNVSDTVTLPLDQYIRPTYLAQKIAPMIEPLLIWNGVVPEIVANGPAIRYWQRDYSKSADPKKEYPPQLANSGMVGRVDVTADTPKTAHVTRRGQGYAVDEEVMRYPQNINMLDRANENCAFWIAEYSNNDIGATITNNWSTTDDSSITDTNVSGGYETTLGNLVLTVTKAWSATTNPDPLEDLLIFQKTMINQTGYGYRITDGFIQLPEWVDLLRYLKDIDAKYQIDPTNTTLTIGQESGLWGMTLHLVNNAFFNRAGTAQTHKGIFIDRNAMPAQTYYGVIPGYQRAGKVHVNSFTDNETRKRKVDMFYEDVTVVTEPKAILLVTGI